MALAQGGTKMERVKGKAFFVPWLLAIVVLTPSVVSAQLLSPEERRELEEGLTDSFRRGARMSQFRWAPHADGEPVPLASLKLRSIRIEPPRRDWRCNGEPCPRFTVVLMLGASPSKEHPTIKQAFFHTVSLSDASTAVQDLRSGKIKGFWVERFTAPKDVGAGKNPEWQDWWEIRGLEY